MLGLAITSSTIDWVMLEGGDSGCPTVTEGQVTVADGAAGPEPAELADAASAVAERARAMLSAGGERLHGVAVSWSDEASAGAAMLLEWLTDADFDHVVPVRYQQAVSGPALARIAALTAMPHTELAGYPAAAGAPTEAPARAGSGRTRSRSLIGAISMLTLGALAFVGSVAAVLSLHLGAGRDVPAVEPQHATVARVAVPAGPPAAAPESPEAPASVFAEEHVEEVAEEIAGQAPDEGLAELGSLWDAPVIEVEAPVSVPSRSDRVRLHLFGPAGA